MIFNALKKPERLVRAKMGGRSALQMRQLTWALGWKERALTADRRQEQACLFNNSNGKARCEREEGRGSAVSTWRARPLGTVETAMKRPGVGREEGPYTLGAQGQNPQGCAAT